MLLVESRRSKHRHRRANLIESFECAIEFCVDAFEPGSFLLRRTHGIEELAILPPQPSDRQFVAGHASFTPIFLPGSLPDAGAWERRESERGRGSVSNFFH